MGKMTLPDYEVENVTPGYITLRVLGKRIKIGGEALVPTKGQPSYIVYRNQISVWLPPDVAPLSDEEKKLIEDVILDWAAREHRAIEIE